MKIYRFLCLRLPILVSAIISSSASATVTIDWVPVGNAGNSPDPSNGYGAVSYDYYIGKYEVTNSQYAEFLNAKGGSNSYGIYNSNMASYGITQSGTSGSFIYNVTGTLANRPVVYVSWFDAARFSNWIHNGQGSGDTEVGAYTLNGAMNGIILSNVGATVHLPDHNEWYKAAFYNGESSTYSIFPNQTNLISTADANYASSGSKDVGTYTGDSSHYGTFDQGGNVWEWNDAISGSSRLIMGGGWDTPDFAVSALSTSSASYITAPTGEYFHIGFRVAGTVPEPTAIFLVFIGSGMFLLRRER